MDFKNMDEQIIQKYQEDEQLMIRLFVQWCTNHQLDPKELYQRAYPAQQENEAMQKIIEETDEEDNIHIDHETMLDVLQLFGNEDLAFVVAEEIARLP
ncbi:hypothetical protein MHZ95_10035 [Sporosarcina sp. ACRSM]|uniref:hypothetical protein n=1 Tax=Sporosarcina sp. ACRSM TaxID=2918216 RepID=UPI001EF71DDB|nr:hypothetical protein [Sporosarcina sp. ACRSM]MCG7335618.1 hypothetical protein [Sporosarcina sp. ACRSM]